MVYLSFDMPLASMVSTSDALGTLFRFIKLLVSKSVRREWEMLVRSESGCHFMSLNKLLFFFSFWRNDLLNWCSVKLIKNVVCKWN